jgi:hypothetical protein
MCRPLAPAYYGDFQRERRDNVVEPNRFRSEIRRNRVKILPCITRASEPLAGAPLYAGDTPGRVSSDLLEEAHVDSDERRLWVLNDDRQRTECYLRSCCSGAELQLRITDIASDTTRIVLRELYPLKSDLYERARELQRSYGVQPASNNA